MIGEERRTEKRKKGKEIRREDKREGHKNVNYICVILYVL